MGEEFAARPIQSNADLVDRVFPNETTAELPPPPVANAQHQIAQYVQAWMMEWHQHCIEQPDSCVKY
jgi:hypothetical protein